MAAGVVQERPAIAEQLSLAAKSVETYVGTIFSKLGLEPEPSAHRRVLAVLAWLRAR